MTTMLRICLLALLPILGIRTAAAAEPLEIRAAWIATPATLIPLMSQVPGLMRRNGTSYKFEPVYYTSSPTQITALASGDPEIGTLNFTSFPFAVLNAKLNLRIIADDTEDGYADYATIDYNVRRDDPIRTPADLKDHVLAVIGLGAATDIAMRTELLKYGLHYPTDYNNLVEVRPPTAKAMLLEHKVDLIEAGLPWVFDPELIAKSRTLFTMKQAMDGPSALSFWVVREDFLQAHRAALIDLLQDTIRAYRWFADPANHDQAVAVLAKATKVPAAQLTNWAFTHKGPYRDPDARPDLAVIQHDVDDMTTLGFIKQHLDVKRYMDMSLVTDARRQLALK